VPKYGKVSSLQRSGRTETTRRWLFIFLGLALLIGAVKTCTLITGHSNPLDRTINRASAPLVVAIQYIGEGIASLGNVFRLPSLLHEERRLQSENKHLRREIAESAALVNENARLRKLLGLRPPGGFKPVVASISARPYDLWMDMVMLNKGYDSNIQQGNLVINEDGLVGMVKEVQTSYCWVELAVSPRFRLAARAGKSQSNGVIRGIDASNLKLMYIAAESKIQVGEQVFTTEVDDAGEKTDLRPGNILIGTVNGRKADQNGFLDVSVAPAVNPNRLSNVMVLTK
jgi:rod shape-determining protein MreC